MPHKVRIALDAMGGDHGAAIVVAGAELSLARYQDIEFLLFGDGAVLAPLLEARPRLKPSSRIVHTDVAIKMHDKPRQELRKGRWKSSMWLAVDAVKKSQADAAVSAGNTGQNGAGISAQLSNPPGAAVPNGASPDATPTSWASGPCQPRRSP